MLEYLGRASSQELKGSLDRKKETLPERVDNHEATDSLRKPASGHQILCAHHSRFSHLTSPSDGLAQQEPGVSPHTCLCSRWLRQDHLTGSLGTIVACKPPSTSLGLPR